MGVVRLDSSTPEAQHRTSMSELSPESFCEMDAIKRENIHNNDSWHEVDKSVVGVLKELDEVKREGHGGVFRAGMGMCCLGKLEYHDRTRSREPVVVISRLSEMYELLYKVRIRREKLAWNGKLFTTTTPPLQCLAMPRTNPQH